MDSRIWTDATGGPMSDLEPWFVLSFPRSRTAWLSAWLTGAGVFCFHEAWKLADSPAQLHALMSTKGPGPVVNSDSSNVFFLPALQEEFPDARYIRILHDEDAVLASLRESYGHYDYRETMDCYRQAFKHAPCDITLDCRHWTDESVRALWRAVAGPRPFDQHWYDQVSGMLIQLMPEQIARDTQRVLNGELSHIITATRQWRTSWV